MLLPATVMLCLVGHGNFNAVAKGKFLISARTTTANFQSVSLCYIAFLLSQSSMKAISPSWAVTISCASLRMSGSLAY
jgi:hypothetical protein